MDECGGMAVWVCVEAWPYGCVWRHGRMDECGGMAVWMSVEAWPYG
jgi:hypothetical protein